MTGLSTSCRDRARESTGPHSIHMENWIDRAPFERLLHMEIREAADGRALLTMPFLLDFAQGGGLLHGGALISLADTAVAMAIKSLLPSQTHFATISLDSKFLYPVRKGVVTAKAQVVLCEGRTMEGRATVYSDENKAVLEFHAVFKVAREARAKELTTPAGSPPRMETGKR
jgi:acyl-CoA thioesterase